MFVISLSIVDMNSRSIVLTCIKSLLSFNHCICTFDFFLFLTFVSCLLTVTLHIVDVRLTCLINSTYLLTYLLTFVITVILFLLDHFICLSLIHSAYRATVGCCNVAVFNKLWEQKLVNEFNHCLQK